MNPAVTQLYAEYLQHTGGDKAAAASLTLAAVMVEDRQPVLEPTAPPEAALSIKQAAARLAVSTRSIYELCAEGRLRAFKVGRLLRIAPESLEEYQRRGAVAACRRVEPLLGRRNRC